MITRKVVEADASVHLPGRVVKPIASLEVDGRDILVLPDTTGKSFCFATPGFPCRELQWVPMALLDVLLVNPDAVK